MSDARPRTNADRTRHAVADLFAAIAMRDLRAVTEALHPDASWQNVPHAPATGRRAVIELLAPIITWSDRVRWDVVTADYGDATAWVERADRFWIEGQEHAVQCNGVLAIHDGVVHGVRDYSDLGEWRARIGPVLDRLARRTPRTVVQRHLDAVAQLDPIAMAADYALDAMLVRGPERFAGQAEIAGYFDTVPARLDGSSVHFGALETPADDTVVVPWQVGTGRSIVTSGRDTYVVELGRIMRQSVTLDGPDF